MSIRDDDSASFINKYRRYSESRGKLRIAIIIAIIIALVLNIVLLKNLFTKVSVEHKNKKAYKSAVTLYEDSFANADVEGMESSYQSFVDLGSYKDSVDYAARVYNDKELVSKYNEGIRFFNDKSYVDAFDCFSYVTGRWDTDSYVTTMSDELYQEAVVNIEEHDYAGARNKLKIIPEYSEEYGSAQELYSLIDGYEQEYNNSLVYAEAVSFYESGDLIMAQKNFLTIAEYSDSSTYLEKIGKKFYRSAKSDYGDKNYGACVDILNRIDTSEEWNGYEKAVSLMKTAKTDYRTKIERNASKKLRSEGYSAMKEYVNSCVNAAFTSSDATAVINTYKPVELSTLTPFEEDSWQAAPYIASAGFSNTELYFEDGIRDCDGNTYANTMLGGGYYSSYYLDGKYTYLTGVMFVLEGCQATKDKPVILAVFSGDGEQLFYDEVLSGYGPKSFTIDVSGVESISVYFDGFHGDFVWGNDVYGGVGEFCLIP